jgi:prepilin-type N-terminal cleavage/methylation domain-containing protein
MKHLTTPNHRTARTQSGFSLLEMTVALGVLLVVAVGSMSLAGVSLTNTENQGHLQARTAEYAQDKMEQLLALTFCDSSTDTTVFPASSAGGTGLAGCVNNPNPNILPTPLTGGSASVTGPAAGYVDYVDGSGNPTDVSTNWQYIRVWQITIPPGSNLMKQISVTCQVRNSIAGRGATPTTTVVSLKSYPF